MKRLTPILSTLLLVALVACAPPRTVENHVVPTLISVKAPQDAGGTVHLQGRYLSDGQGGAAEDSYVVVGADSSCRNGVELASTDVWTADRVEFAAPEGVGAGFVCVVVNGTASTPMPLDLP